MDKEPQSTLLQTLARRLNDIVVMNSVPHGRMQTELTVIRQEIQKVAMHEAGVTASDLADEDQENSPQVCRYWDLLSYITAKVYMQAAQQLSSYVELDR